jgi:hypothetical protein
MQGFSSYNDRYCMQPNVIERNIGKHHDHYRLVKYDTG